ncbi:MAG: hypothetical protein LBF80_06065 [Spirochaetaceae bacterium]|nr:hypothetical protein [Spirochaetaceae bacterium]
MGEVRELIETAEYEVRAKKREQDFSRNRKMPFKKLMWFMLNIVHESAGIQSGSEKRKVGSISGIVPSEREGKL